MPAIRDSSWAYETTTTDAGITIPMCSYASNDLLIVFAMGDTGAPTWTAPSGFKQFFARNNTTSNVCFFKIATGSESDPVVGSTVNETYNGCVIAIRDIDTKTPFCVVDAASYSESNVDSYANLGDATTTGLAQSFAGVARILAKAKFYLKKNGSPTGNAVAKLYAHSGTFGTSSVPTGSALATSDNFDVSTLTTSAQLIEFIFSSSTDWYTMASATNYVISIEYSGGNASNYVQVGYDGSSPGHGGNYSANTGTWAADSARDLAFYVQNFDYTEAANSGGSRVNASTITTDRDDALVFYWHSASAVSAPTFLEGPVHHLTGGDGAAESMGVGWAYQKTAGTTSSSIYCNSYATGSGIKALFGVHAPSSGANVIPPYISNDACSFLDPLHGVTAYNGNTAFAATADTNFGTSLGGVTANDGTVAAIADVGLNSFNSMAGLTNAATSGQISGAELVFSVGNRPNVGNQNILCHVRASTPANLQRHSTILSGRGCWFGMRSNTTGTSDHKIWQIHGSDAPWGSGAHVPIVINNGAGNTKDTAGTLSTSAITAFGFWDGGLGALTAQMGFGSLWLMGKTTVAGGNSSEPLDISGIVKVAADAKFRKSSILQGAEQMLCLQDMQIGDGGTNPVYLDLDGSAIEFPGQYDSSRKQVNYNSTDNLIGILYYPGSSDTIRHRNSVVSSRSRYFWGLHASASASATYAFDGLLVIGAGTITLNKAITISELTINDYSTLDISGASLVSCLITNPPSSNDSLTTSSSTTVSATSVTVTSVSPGNRWCSVACADLDIFSDCSFTGSARSGHAIRITSTGTVSFSGNNFTSFGPAARSFNTGTGVDSGTDVITMDAAHGYTTGDPVYYQDQGGAQSIGLTDGNLYYVRNIGSNQLAFYSTQSNAETDTSRINLTSSGSETHYIYSAGAAIYNNSGGLVTINVTGGGSTPSIRNSDGSSTTVNNSVTYTVTGLISGSEVRIFRISDNAELGGVESSGTSFAYDYNYVSDTPVKVIVQKLDYEWLQINDTLTSTSKSQKVLQSPDYNYANL